MPEEQACLPLRLLVIAEACNPDMTSVPLVGYNICRALAACPGLKVTILTQIRNKRALERNELSSLVPIDFVDTEWIARPFNRISQWISGRNKLSWTITTAFSWPSYVAFEREVFRRYGRKLQAGEFDLIHRVTPLSPTLAGPLASLVNVPMVVGPLNGGLTWPRQFPELIRKEREWLVPFRHLHQNLPYFRSTFRHLAAVIAGSQFTDSQLPHYFHRHRFYMPENGIDPKVFPLASAWPESKNRFRFITVGRLVPYKGFDLILKAMGQSDVLRACELLVIGDGPYRAELNKLVHRYGLESSVRFLGWLKQSDLAPEYRRCQAFVFPSLREFGGGVVLEAMASALPSIVVDYGGPGELVTPACGLRLPLKPRGELVALLRQGMEQLAGDPVQCRLMGQAAAQRVREEFTWSKKAAQLVRIYHRVLSD